MFNKIIIAQDSVNLGILMVEDKDTHERSFIKLNDDGTYEAMELEQTEIQKAGKKIKINISEPPTIMKYPK